MAAAEQIAFEFGEGDALPAEHWHYVRGLPDRSGAAIYVHIIRAPGDPDERMARGAKARARTPGSENDRKKKSGTPEEWCARIVEHLRDGEPRTFNRITVELIGATADALLHSPIDRGLWLAVERELIAYTLAAPVFFIGIEHVAWDRRSGEPRLWEEFGSRRLMCSWCGARNATEWRRQMREGSVCIECHFAEKGDDNVIEPQPQKAATQ